MEVGDLVYYDGVTADVSGQIRFYGTVVEVVELSDKCRIYWYHLAGSRPGRRYINDISRLVIEDDDEI